MASRKEKYYTINTRILKLIGFYQIASSHVISNNGFGVHFYRLLNIIQLAVQFIFIWILIIHVIYAREDINNVTQYLIIFIAYVLAFTQFHCVFSNSDKIWDCIKSTSNNNLAYKYHNEQILQAGKWKSKLYSILFIVSWTTNLLCWWMSPLFMDNYYMKMTAINGLPYHYRYNILNLVLPVTDKFYNDNYVCYYIFELISTVITTQFSLLFQVLIILICVTIVYQLKTVRNSFSNFSIAHTSLINNKNKSLEKSIDLVLINDLKLLIKDHQHIMKNLRHVYKIFQRVTLLLIVTQSMEIILCWSLTITNYYNDMPLMYPSNQKTLGTALMFMIHLLFVCYLFNEINEQKDSMIFAMYSCDWTDRSIHFKKLLLLSMHMNNANNLNLRVTTTKLVNLEMYSSIIRRSYSIISVLSKYYGNKL